ncbi:MAG TPA: chlorite dismutase family protein, partial [Planctomycetaceae bacterium]|nr:chlorite dismutase family protein [Planctomycetaceae bacterium]
MSRQPHAPAPLPDPTVRMSEGWHCLHLYYRVDPAALSRLDESVRAEGRAELLRLLDPEREGAPQRMQCSLISGHKADLGLMLLDPDPLLIDSVTQAVRASGLGPAFVPVYSFVSITEVSEYVPTIEQYG